MRWSFRLSSAPAHRPGWLSQRLLLPDGEESRCLEYLEESGQIRRDGTHYEQQTMAVDTRSNPQLSARLKAHRRCGAERIEAGSPGQFSYNVFISRRDFERIRALHLAYYHQLRSIVAQSAPVEQVAVVNIQLFTLDSAAQD